MSVLSVWYYHIHRRRAIQADKGQTMTSLFGVPLVSHDSLPKMTNRLTDQWSAWWRRSETDRWLRHMVVFPGEGAVEGFERLAVLFVSFNRGLDNLRVRGDLQERGGIIMSWKREEGGKPSFFLLPNWRTKKACVVCWLPWLCFKQVTAAMTSELKKYHGPNAGVSR